MPRTSCAPLVSVVIPCFNYGRFLPHALDSLLRQSYQDWECIIIDDGSTDDTRHVSRGYAALDDRIRWMSIPRRGASAARNHGLRASRGRLVQFLDADDLLEENKLAQQVECFARHRPPVDIVYSSARYFTTAEPGRRDYSVSGSDTPWIPELSGPGMAVLPVLADRNIMPINAALVSRDLIDRVGGFNEGLRCAEDWEYWIRCALAEAAFLYSDRERARALVRRHDGSTTATQRMAMLKDSFRLREWALAKVPARSDRVPLQKLLTARRIALQKERIRNGEVLAGSLGLLLAQARARQVRPAFRSAFLISAAPLLERHRFVALILGEQAVRRLLRPGI